MENLNLKAILFKFRYFIVCFFIICFIAVIGVNFIYKYVDLMKKESSVAAREHAILISDGIEDLLKKADQTVQTISNSEYIRSFLESKDSALLDDVYDELDFYALDRTLICYVMDLKGNVIATSNRDAKDSFLGKNYGFRPYFKRAFDEERAFYFALGVTSGIRGYYTSILIRDDIGRKTGVVVVKKQLTEEEAQVKEYGDFIAVSPDNIVFLSSKKDFLFKSLYPLPEEKINELVNSKQFGKGPFDFLYDNILEEGQIIDFKGQDSIIALHALSQPGWKVVSFHRLAQIRLNATIIASIFFFSGFLVFWFCYYLHQKDKFVTQLKQSEQRYLSIFEAQPQVTIILNKNNKILACNSKIKDVLGYTTKQILGKYGLEVFCEGNIGNDVWSNVREQGKVKDFIVKGKNKNDQNIDININADHVPLAKSETDIDIVCVLEDITQKLADIEELRIAREKEAKSAEEYKLTREATLNILEDLQDAKNSIETDRRGFLNVIENSWDGIVIVDDKNIVRFLNRSAQEIYGKDRTQLIGKKFPHSIKAEETSLARITHDLKSTVVEMRVAKTEWMQQQMQLIVMHDITAQEEAKSLLLKAAEEWRLTFDAIGDGVSLLNEKGHIVRCNNAAAKIFGKQFPEVIGFDCVNYFCSDEEKEDCHCVIKETFKTGQRNTGTRFKNNKWYLLSADPLTHDEEVTGVVFTVSDITEQKINEQKIKESAEYIENIVETAQALIVVLDDKLLLKSINRFAEDLLGYQREDIFSKDWIDLVVAQEYKEETRQVLENSLEGERLKGFEVPFITKEGKEIMISWHSAELKDGQGKVIGVVTMGYDVSQRKEMEKVQRLAQLGTLVSHMAHEVNNPLMVISGRAQLSLMEEIENQEIKDNLNVVLKECKRAKEIIQRLLRFSRPSKGERKEIDLNKSLAEVVNLLEHQLTLDNVKIEQDIQPNLDPIIGDDKQLHEVFVNLLTNAADAIPGEGKIIIEAKQEHGFINIRFVDDGEGISPDVLKKIFEPFFTTKKKGTGLGLAICKSIINEHNGQLRFDSVVGIGTTVNILLPVMKKENDNV